MPRVMVLGKREAVLPFRAAGVEIVDVAGVEEARDALRGVAASGGEALVLIPEELAAGCAAEIEAAREGASVVVMTLPASAGGAGAQRERVRQLVARSIGVDLMGKRG